jgi:ABC-2 type transport system permease protein
MISLLRNELSRSWIMFRRYPVPHIGYAIVTFIIFYGLFLGSQYLAGPVALVEARVDALVIGYIAWTLSLTAVADISLNLQEDMASGTLEHIYLSPFGLTRIYLARGMAKLVINLAITALVGLLIMVATGHWLRPRPLALPAVALMLASAYGFSMIFGGMTLLFKRLGGLFALVQMVLLYLTLMPIEEQPLHVQVLSGLLPVTPGVALLRQVLGSTPRLDTLQLALAAGNAVLYMGAGLFIFQRADARMRVHGSTHHF